MTPDLLSTLRETPGCGKHRVEEIGIGTMWCRDCGRQNPPELDQCWRHEFATNSAQVCDPCLTRLAEAVLTHYGPRIMELARDAVVLTYPDWPSLLSALRSETGPRG